MTMRSDNRVIINLQYNLTAFLFKSEYNLILSSLPDVNSIGVTRNKEISKCNNVFKIISIDGAKCKKRFFRSIWKNPIGIPFLNT